MVRIVVAVDDSPRSRLVARHAERLATVRGHAVVLVHVVEASDGAEAAWLDGLAQDVGAGSAISEAREGSESVAAAFLRASEREGAELAAIATRGLSWPRRMLARSVTHDVLRLAQLPVMAVGPRATPPNEGPGFRATLALDASPRSWEAMTRFAPRILPPEARVELVSVYAPQLGDQGDRERLRGFERRRAELELFLPRAELHSTVLAETTPRGLVNRLSQLAQPDDTDLVAAAATEQAGSVALLARLLGRLEVPLIVLPRPAPQR